MSNTKTINKNISCDKNFYGINMTNSFDENNSVDISLEKLKSSNNKISIVNLTSANKNNISLLSINKFASSNKKNFSMIKLNNIVNDTNKKNYNLSPVTKDINTNTYDNENNYNFLNTKNFQYANKSINVVFNNHKIDIINSKNNSSANDIQVINNMLNKNDFKSIFNNEPLTRDYDNKIDTNNKYVINKTILESTNYNKFNLNNQYNDRLIPYSDYISSTNNYMKTKVFFLDNTGDLASTQTTVISNKKNVIINQNQNIFDNVYDNSLNKNFVCEAIRLKDDFSNDSFEKNIYDKNLKDSNNFFNNTIKLNSMNDNFKKSKTNCLNNKSLCNKKKHKFNMLLKQSFFNEQDYKTYNNNLESKIDKNQLTNSLINNNNFINYKRNVSNINNVSTKNNSHSDIYNELIANANNIKNHNFDEIINFSDNKFLGLAPDKILDAPNLIEELALNPLDWSVENNLAVALMNELYIWDGNNGNVNNLYSLNEDNINLDEDNNPFIISSVKWSKLNKLIAFGDNRGYVTIMDSKKKIKIRELKEFSIINLKYIKNNKLISNPFLESKSIINCIEFYNKQIIIGGNSNILLAYDLKIKNKECLSYIMISNHLSDIVSIKTSYHDKNVIATSSIDGTICLWLFDNVKAISEYKNICDSDIIEIQNIKSKINRNFGLLYPYATFNHQSKSSFNPFNFINSFNNLKGKNLKAIDFCPWEKNIIISAGINQIMNFYNFKEIKLINSISLGSSIYSINWNMLKEKQIITSHGKPNNNISIWNFPQLIEVGNIKEHSKKAVYTAISPDFTTLVSGSGEERLYFWKLFELNEQEIKNKETDNVNNCFYNDEIR